MSFLKIFGGVAAIAVTALIAIFYFSTGAVRAQGPVNTLESKDGVAIKGYDPVAYFVEGRARKGKPEFSAEHDGAKWLFANPGNKALFEGSPERYAPAYGGYCAYGVANGSLVAIDPEAWSIHEGKLYLNYDPSVLITWSKKLDANIKEADKKWPELIAKK